MLDFINPYVLQAIINYKKMHRYCGAYGRCIVSTHPEHIWDDELSKICKNCLRLDRQLKKYVDVFLKKKVNRKKRKHCIVRVIGSAIYYALKNNKHNLNWEQVVGYTLDDLIKHLESQFENGMSWDNYGDWHIDHIKPVSSFNIKFIEDKELKECWSLQNLQPLWAGENIKKGAKIKK